MNKQESLKLPNAYYPEDIVIKLNCYFNCDREDEFLTVLEVIVVLRREGFAVVKYRVQGPTGLSFVVSETELLSLAQAEALCEIKGFDHV